MERVRIDRWLWAARFFKTRSAATDAVAGGHVQVGGERVKPAKEVKIGDTLEIRRDEIRWTVVVTGVADRRGSATVAATLYEETPDSLAARERERLGTPARPAARRRPRRTAHEAGAPAARSASPRGAAPTDEVGSARGPAAATEGSDRRVAAVVVGAALAAAVARGLFLRDSARPASVTAALRLFREENPSPTGDEGVYLYDTTGANRSTSWAA